MVRRSEEAPEGNVRRAERSFHVDFSTRRDVRWVANAISRLFATRPILLYPFKAVKSTTRRTERSGRADRAESVQSVKRTLLSTPSNALDQSKRAYALGSDTKVFPDR